MEFFKINVNIDNQGQAHLEFCNDGETFQYLAESTVFDYFPKNGQFQVEFKSVQPISLNNDIESQHGFSNSETCTFFKCVRHNVTIYPQLKEYMKSHTPQETSETLQAMTERAFSNICIWTDTHQFTKEFFIDCILQGIKKVKYSEVVNALQSDGQID